MNAALKTMRDQIEETEPMEPRLAKLESDVEHIKVGVQTLQKKADAANDVIVALRNEVSHLTTKAELNKVEGELKASISNVEGSLKASISKVEGELKANTNRVEGELKESISRLDARINAMESRIVRWVVGTGLGAAAITLTVVRLTFPSAGISPPTTAVPALSTAEVVSSEQTR